MPMKTPLLEGETVLREGPANLQRGLETVGGRAWLTERRLVFEPHAVNVQTQVEAIPLAEIVSTALCWTKFLGFLPLFPNSLAVTTRDGRERRFVLFGRKAWREAIDAGRYDYGRC